MQSMNKVEFLQMRIMNWIIFYSKRVQFNQVQIKHKIELSHIKKSDKIKEMLVLFYNSSIIILKASILESINNIIQTEMRDLNTLIFSYRRIRKSADIYLRDSYSKIYKRYKFDSNCLANVHVV